MGITPCSKSWADTFPTNMNTVVANKAQEYLGDRKVLMHNVDTEKKRPGQTMKALVWHGKKDVRVDEVPVPAITDPGDVICRVTGTTVCGSDLHLYHKEIMQLQKGDILGHEWMGFGGLFGYTRFAGGFAGGQAEYVRAPFGDVNLLKLPDSVPDEKVLYLSDIVPTLYHSTVCAEVKEGKSVAIWGMGPVGLFR